jgi:hypothetical protein
MTGGVQSAQAQAKDLDFFVILENGQAFLRDGKELAPQGFHIIAIQAGGAGEQLLRVEQVRSADRVDVNACPLMGQPAGSSGMIQVDVGQENVTDVGNPIAMSIQATFEGGDGGTGTRFDQDGALPVGDEISSDGTGQVEEIQIKSVNG